VVEPVPDQVERPFFVPTEYAGQDEAARRAALRPVAMPWEQRA
jgi:hypothetical protein